MKSLVSPELASRFRRWGQRLEDRFPRVSTRLAKARASTELLLEGRLWLFLVLDLVLVTDRLFHTLVIGGRIGELYRSTVLFPGLLLVVPALSTVVSLERKAGGLDLALAVPSTERYFVARILPILTIFWLQSCFVLLAAGADHPVPDLLRALYQTTELTVLVGSAVLFWATRIESSAGTMIATIVTLLLLWPWLSTSPELDRFAASGNRTLGIDGAVWAWGWHALVLAVATVLLALYARARLRRPETLLA